MEGSDTDVISAGTYACRVWDSYADHDTDALTAGTDASRVYRSHIDQDTKSPCERPYASETQDGCLLFEVLGLQKTYVVFLFISE